MNILAINPWIYDFAAYDFWLKPYGFLVLLEFLKNKGAKIDFIDCLDEKLSRDNFGRGKYASQIIEKPAVLKNVPRYFKRYGISIDEFRSKISGKKPDYILVTSSMTYWYPGIVEAVKILRSYFKKTPIFLGGTYATLCKKHAKRKIPDISIFGNHDLNKFFKLINIEFNSAEFYSTLPNYENLYNNLDYIVVRTSWGCPFSCSYCAIEKLSRSFIRIDREKIVNFLLKYYGKGVKNFVLYDDAFLFQREYTTKLLKEIEKLKLNINFHTPNALHVRFLNQTIARLLKKTGFIKPHFGLETLNGKLQKKWGDKVRADDLITGITYLKRGGFKKGEFFFYLLLGYPNQNLSALKKEVDFLHSLGAKVSLAEFSPTPSTRIYYRYRNKLRDPLLHNNSIFTFFAQDKLKKFYEIKNYVRNLNKKLSFTL